MEAIAPPLRTLEKTEKAAAVRGVTHEATLRTLKVVVERAQALLQKQCKRCYVSQLLSHAAVTEGLHVHMQALNLSVVAQDVGGDEGRRRAGGRRGDAEGAGAVDAEEPAELHVQLEGVEAGQEELARKLLEDVAREHAGLRTGIAADMVRNDQKRRSRNDILKRRGGSAAAHAASSLPHIDMESDLHKCGGADDAFLRVGGYGMVRKRHWVGGRLAVAVKELL